MASVRFICGTQSVHKELEAALAAFLETDDSILYSSCFDANGGLFETLLGRGGRGDQRRAQPREHRRRHQALQGEALPLSQQRHGGPRSEARGGRRRGRALQADRDRRRVLDGRHHRRPAVDLRSRRPPRRAGDGRRLARGRLRRRARPRHAGALRRRRPDRHPHRHAGQGAGRRVRRLYGGPEGDRRSAAPALAPVPVLEHARALHRGRVARGAGAAARGRRRGAAPARARERRALPRAR